MSTSGDLLTDKEYHEIMKTILATESCRSANPHEPTMILEGIYLGSQRNAECWKVLERLNITHVLNCAAFKGPRTYLGSPYDGLGIDYYEIHADDTDSYDITKHFPEAFIFIDKARQRKGNILVHCALGINRSGAICLGYLIHRAKLPLLKATKVLKSKRRVVLSNNGFQKQLIRFARARNLLDKSEDEIFTQYSLPRRLKFKGLHERSRSCCNGLVENLRPDVTPRRFVIANGSAYNAGESLLPYYSSKDLIYPKEFYISPGPRYLESFSTSRFDLLPYSFY